MKKNFKTRKFILYLVICIVLLAIDFVTAGIVIKNPALGFTIIGLLDVVAIIIVSVVLCKRGYFKEFIFDEDKEE